LKLVGLACASSAWSAESAVLAGDSPAPHRIQGIAAGFTPRYWSAPCWMRFARSPSRNRSPAARRCAAIEGLPIGISSGAVLHTHARPRRPKGNRGKLIVA